MAKTETAVLFMPGNGGSYEQVRSLGSRATQVHVYAMDFNEEWSAFDGRLLRRQIKCARKWVRQLRTQYDRVLVVAHSIGGLAAVRASRGPVLTLAAPHFAHPFAADAAMVQVLRSPPRSNSIVSLTGGPRDWQVPDWLSTTSEENVIHLTAADLKIPTTDHQCALWCNELIRLIAAWCHGDETPFDATRRVSSPAATTLSAAWPYLETQNPVVFMSQLAVWLVPRFPALFVARGPVAFAFAVRELANGASLGVAIISSLLVTVSSRLLVELQPSNHQRHHHSPSRYWWILGVVMSVAVTVLRVHPAPCLLLASATVDDAFARGLYAASAISLGPSFAAVATARHHLPPPPFRTTLLAAAALCHVLLGGRIHLPHRYHQGAALLCIPAAVFATPDRLLDVARAWASLSTVETIRQGLFLG